jgi:heme/copper-type cytochrome/quinol oxidase subunit 4
MNAAADSESGSHSASAAGDAEERVWRQVLAFALLLGLTALEVVVAGLEVDRAARVTALVGLATTKVGVVLRFFMGVGREPRVLRLAAYAPLLLAPIVAVALLLDAVVRVRLR